MIIDGYTTLNEELTRDSLLQQLDKAGIDRAVIGLADHEFAVSNREGNKRLADEASKADGRLIPTCTVTPWQRDLAMDVLDEAIAIGAKMLIFSPAVQGFMLTDPIIDPLLEHAGKDGLPVYVHTGPHSMGAPTQTILAAQKHPATTFILGHCGTTDHAWDIPQIAKNHMGNNIYLELSLVRPWASPNLVDMAGSDRVIYGSAAPTTDLVFEFEHFSHVLPVAENKDIFGGNLLRLLGEDA